MLVRSLLLPLLAACGVAAKARASKGPTVLKGKYIVELEDSHDLPSFMTSIKNVASGRMDLDYTLFKGASIEVHDKDRAAHTAAEIASMNGVKSVSPVRLYPIPQHQVLWSGSKEDGGNSADKHQIYFKRQEDKADTFSPHVMTQVDALRAEGITGAGINVAVIDTGIDYNHPALGGCFGPGCLVSYGTDLVGDAYDGFNDPVPDSDPVDCAGHGTHVAGIIAAQNNTYGFTGAAPDVTLGIYKVFGCEGQVGNDVLIAAYNQAYEAGADIITASIGGASGWSEDSWAVAVQRIVEKGVICTVSAGNDGSEGIFYASTAANGIGVTAVASIDNTKAPTLLTSANYSVGAEKEEAFGYTPGTPDAWGGVDLPLWAIDFDTTDPADGCEAFPADTPDLSKYVVLIRRGSCTFVEKLTNAAAKGAQYVLFYNNVPAGTTQVEGVSVSGIKAIGMVTAEQGEEWISALESGSEVVVSFNDPETSPVTLDEPDNLLTGGYLSTYTSWGPTWELDSKPQVAAPGGQILSTYPLELGGYAVLSGTSMACPITAGIIALIAQSRGTLDPRTIENLLSATSIAKQFNDGTDTYPFLAPTVQQGSGLIQAYNAAHASTILSVSSLSFNDTANFAGTLNFTISNTLYRPVTYTIGHSGAASFYTFDPFDPLRIASFVNDGETTSATLEFSDDKVTIEPRSSAVVAVTPTPPDLDPERLPVYSGYVTLNSSMGENLSLPYMGVAGSIHEHAVLGDIALFSSKDEDMTQALGSNHSFTLPPQGHGNDTAWVNSTRPVLGVELVLGSPVTRVDAVPCGLVNGTFTDPLSRDGTRTLGQIETYPVEWMPRGPLVSAWDGRLADGSYAPAGAYKLAVKALRILGDRSNPEEYDAGETVEFRIQYASGGLRKGGGMPALPRRAYLGH